MTQRTTAGAAPPPGPLARLLLVAAVLSSTYVSFFAYKTGGFDAPTALDARLQGLASAPDQYRMGVYLAAHWMVSHLHIAPTMALALIDGISALFAVLLLFTMLEHSATYTRATRLLQWLGATAFVLAIIWWLLWMPWLQKPETLPAAAFVALLAWLWTPHSTADSTWLLAAALLTTTLALASFRADIACLLSAGILLCTLRTSSPGLSISRVAAIITAALCALAAGGMQLWLAKVIYPQATYGRVKLWQLWPNVIHATRWPPFVLALLPSLLILVRNLRRGFVGDAVSRALLTAALLYAALWITIGKIDEVRIFLPFAWALAPLTAQTFMRWLATFADQQPAS